MEFNIRKNSTFPSLKFEIINDGRSDFHSLVKQLSGYTIFISLTNTITKIVKTYSRPVTISEVYSDSEGRNIYYIEYILSAKETNEVGRYQVSFTTNDNNGSMTLPFDDNYYLNILDSFSSTDFCC